jgi:hypothetical protein
MVVVHSANTEIKIELNLFGKKDGHFPDFRLSCMILAMSVNWLIGAKYSHLYIYCKIIILATSILVKL